MWITAQSLADESRLADVQLPAGVSIDDCIQAASDVLYRRSGRRYALRTATIRPNHLRSGCTAYGGPCDDHVAELSLPRPVVEDSITVTIDGAVLPTSEWSLYDRHILVRETLGLGWPCCQSLAVPLGEVGTWSVAFAHGNQPPMTGLLACRELSIHVALSLSGKSSKLPSRAVSVSRQGISVSLQRSMKGGTLQQRPTGISLVDDFLEAVNPNNLSRQGRVASPDTIRRSAL